MTDSGKKNESSLILVVDDRKNTRILIRAALEQAGFMVEEASNGLDALSVFKRNRPDIVLLDVMMPKMDGFTTCTEIRKLAGSHYVPIIITTALEDIEAINRAYEVGATDFITKPLNYVILVNRLRYMIRTMRIKKIVADQAIRDSLTGLYNRRYFSTRIYEELSRAGRDNQHLAIFLCDLDNFKSINNSLGHHIGDKILKASAVAIRSCLREFDLVFRWGGDEIVIILPKYNKEDGAPPGLRIRDAIKQVGKEISPDLDLDVSIGISFYPDHGDNPDELMRVSNKALDIAKKSEGSVQIGEDAYHLDEYTVKVVFQPIVELDSRKILGYEALTRDPKGELNVAELFKKYQTIGKLRELMVICFKKQIKTAIQLGLEKVFINADFKLLEKMGRLPKPDGFEVIIEISEVEALHDVDKNLDIVRKWREQGYKFAIDDFGAGFISLPFIALAMPEYIKLDRSTMLLAVSSAKFRAFLWHLTQALSNYASEGIIAEGIETEDELKIMQEMGIPLAQGYLLGRPQDMGKPKLDIATG